MLGLFEDFLKRNLPQAPSYHPYYEKAFGEMLLAGGKRFRPLLLLSVVDALNPAMLQNSLYPALAIEFLHTYSLIHDDLPAMDNADLRRGHPTLHKTYDEVTAILVGDALNTASFGLIIKAPLADNIKVKLVDYLSFNGCEMVLGQAIDCHYEKKELDLEKLRFLHNKKTARLIGSALAMGAVIADVHYEKILYEYGLMLGELFQIRDDILDIVSSEEASGKSIGRDEHKNSFVTFLGIDGAIKAFDDIVQKSKDDLQKFPQQLQNSLSPILQPYFKLPS